MDPAGKDRAARLFRAAERLTVVTGLAAVVLGTVPGVESADGSALTGVTLAVATLFGVECAARVLAPEPGPTGSRGWAGWPPALVDLAAAAGVPSGLLFGLTPADARLLGMVWLFKLVRYSPAFAMLTRVLREEREALGSVLLAFAIGLGVAATGGYLLERDAQPEAFGSIPAAL